MLALRFAAVLALVFWIGGLVALGTLAAPAAFDVLGARGAEGRALAGAVFGETLKRFHLVAYAAGGLLIASLAIRAVLGPRPRRFALRLLVAAGMLACAIWTGFVLIPRVESSRRSLGTSPALLPDADPRREAFGRLHGLAGSLQLVPVLGGLFLLFFELED
jgi:hypothetical protein